MPTDRHDFGRVEALANAAHDEPLTPAALANVLGCNREQISRWRRDGLTARSAERLAKALGLLDFEVFPELLDHAIRDVEVTDYKKREQKRRYQAAWAKARYQSDPEYREKRLERGRAYHAAARQANRAQVGRWVAANREQYRATKRAWWAQNAEAQNARRREKYAERRREVVLPRVQEEGLRLLQEQGQRSAC